MCLHGPRRPFPTGRRFLLEENLTPTYELARLWFTPRRETRFWRAIKKTENCWLWKKATFESGYGKYRLAGGTVRVHRLTWILANKQDISEGQVVRHGYCRNPACVNPDHLTLGTQEENVHDIAIHKAYAEATSTEASSVFSGMYRRFVTVV